jgi:L-seryl-tRNA(Ser) seleniumtransferase
MVGRRDLIEQIRRHPLYRALRVGKLAYAALETTLGSYLRDDLHSIPVLRMLASTKGELEERARAFADRLKGTAGAAAVGIVDGESVVGGGSAPDVRLATTLISVRHPELTADEIERKLRSSETPVIARIENDDVLIDLRTVETAEEDRLLEMLASVLV